MFYLKRMPNRDNMPLRRAVRNDADQVIALYVFPVNEPVEVEDKDLPAMAPLVGKMLNVCDQHGAALEQFPTKRLQTKFEKCCAEPSATAERTRGKEKPSDPPPETAAQQGDAKDADPKDAEPKGGDEESDDDLDDDDLESAEEESGDTDAGDAESGDAEAGSGAAAVEGAATATDADAAAAASAALGQRASG